MIQELVDRVTAFHEKHGFPVGRSSALHEEYDSSTIQLNTIATKLKSISKNILEEALHTQECMDARMYRTHLMLEELGEMIQGMADADGVAVLDGGMDLLFVLMGTLGTTYDFPVDEAWEEVCKSNESKQVRQVGDARMRDKGPDYIAPDLDKILTQHRCTHDWVQVGEPIGFLESRYLKCSLCGKEGLGHE